MKRMHLHVSVPDLAQSIDFYATLFGAPPSVVKSDYAKWMLEDPRVNFAISQRGGPAASITSASRSRAPASSRELAGAAEGRRRADLRRGRRRPAATPSRTRAG